MPLARNERILLETGLVFLAFVLPASLTGTTSAEITGITPLLPGLLLSALPQAGLVLYLLALGGEIGRPELGLRRPTGREVLGAIGLVPLMLGVLALAQLLLRLIPPDAAAGASQGARFRLAGWAEIPVALVFAPVAAAREEILYRGYLYVRLRDLGLPPAVALLTATALFGAAHAYQGILAVGLALAQGLILGLVFVRWRSLAVTVIAHTTYNVLLLTATLIPGLGLSR